MTSDVRERLDKMCFELCIIQESVYRSTLQCGGEATIVTAAVIIFKGGGGRGGLKV
jgi:hypothetical protein